MTAAGIRRWKAADLAGQSGTVLVPFLWWAFAGDSGVEASVVLLTAFAANTAWVLVSLLVHLGAWRALWIAAGRKAICLLYLLTLAASLVLEAAIGRVTIGIPPSLLVLLLLPLLSLPYLLVSIVEWRRVRR